MIPIIICVHGVGIAGAADGLAGFYLFVYLF